MFDWNNFNINKKGRLVEIKRKQKHINSSKTSSSSIDILKNLSTESFSHEFPLAQNNEKENAGTIVDETVKSLTKDKETSKLNVENLQLLKESYNTAETANSNKTAQQHEIFKKVNAEPENSSSYSNKTAQQRTIFKEVNAEPEHNDVVMDGHSIVLITDWNKLLKSAVTEGKPTNLDEESDCTNALA